MPKLSTMKNIIDPDYWSPVTKWFSYFSGRDTKVLTYDWTARGLALAWPKQSIIVSHQPLSTSSAPPTLHYSQLAELLGHAPNALASGKAPADVERLVFNPDF